jgi:translation initiation factor 3 subunit J
VARKYLIPHAAASHYKALLKHLIRAALGPLSSQEVKDVETSVAGVRSEKLKEEKAAAGGKKTAASKKVTLNVGRGGGSAGLEDYIYDDALDDDGDFM